MRKWYNEKMLKMGILSRKAKNEALKLSFAVVVAEFVIVIALHYGFKSGLYEYLQPKTVVIINEAQAKTPKEQPKEETTQEIIERTAKKNNFNDVETLLKLAECESNFNRYAKNKTSSARGLFQILDIHGLTEDERYDPEIATEWTIEKIRKDGLTAWKSSQKCWNK